MLNLKWGVRDEPRSGRSMPEMIEKIHKVVLEDRQIKLREIAETRHIKLGTDLCICKLKRAEAATARYKLNYIFVSHTETNRTMIHMCDVCTMRAYWAFIHAWMLASAFYTANRADTCPHCTHTEHCLALMDQQPMDRVVHYTEADCAMLSDLHACPHLHSMLRWGCHTGACCASLFQVLSE